MILTGENLMVVGSVLLLAGVLIGKASYRTGLPLLLVFLLVGMMFGVDGFGLHFDSMHTAQSVGMVALCIILFSGGMNTAVRSIRPVLGAGLTLATVGVAVTALLTGLFIFWLSGQPWTNIHFALLPSLLLAATMSSTDSASVFGILGSRNIRLKENLRPMLELESGSNDPMAYMLTIILIECISAGADITFGGICMELLMQFGVGAVMGVALGWAGVWLARLYRRIGSEETVDAGQGSAMVSFIMLAIVFITFTVTTRLNGNGYLAVYICGIYIGNSGIPFKTGVSKFMDGITWLAQIVVFILLGLLVNPHEMLRVAPVSILIGTFMILLGRPLSVFLCLMPFRRLTYKAKTFVSWVGLRGAVPIIFATYPVVADVPGASQIFNIVFFVAVLSLIVQGTTIVSAAGRLGLVDDSPDESESFGVELEDEHPASLETMLLGEADLKAGRTLSEMKLPEGSLVVMVRRNGKYIVPNGKRRLNPGDVLLLIKESGNKESGKKGKN